MENKTVRLLTGLLFLFFSGLNAFAQDIITTKNGDKIKAKIVQSSETTVEYKPYNFQEGPSIFRQKKDITNITYEDGRYENFDTPVAPQPTANASATINPNELSKELDKLSTQIADLNSGQTKQTKALTETLTALNTNITSLKTVIEQGNADEKKQGEEMGSKLNTLTASVNEMNETAKAKVSTDEKAITPRKFGMGVNFITNYLLGNFIIADGDGNPITNEKEGQYSGLFFGAGFNLIISTNMDKKVGFRYEPEFSVASRFNSSKDATGTTSDRQSIFSFGSRFFGVARRNRVNIYAGPSITVFGVVQAHAEAGEVTTGSNVGAGFGLHFGGEYLIHPNFGINMESGMQLLGLFPKNGAAEGVFSTYARLGGRFYF